MSTKSGIVLRDRLMWFTLILMVIISFGFLTPRVKSEPQVERVFERWSAVFMIERAGVGGIKIVILHEEQPKQMLTEEVIDKIAEHYQQNPPAEGEAFLKFVKFGRGGGRSTVLDTLSKAELIEFKRHLLLFPKDKFGPGGMEGERENGVR